MNKYIKIGIAAAVVLVSVIAIIVQLNSPNVNTKNEAQKAFAIVDAAFKENRELTDYDRMELKKFEKLRKERVEKYMNDEANRKEKEDAVLLYAVGEVLDLYSVDMNDEELELFLDKYNKAKILLE